MREPERRYLCKNGVEAHYWYIPWEDRMILSINATTPEAQRFLNERYIARNKEKYRELLPSDTKCQKTLALVNEKIEEEWVSIMITQNDWNDKTERYKKLTKFRQNLLRKGQGKY